MLRRITRVAFAAVWCVTPVIVCAQQELLSDMPLPRMDVILEVEPDTLASGDTLTVTVVVTNRSSDQEIIQRPNGPNIAFRIVTPEGETLEMAWPDWLGTGALAGGSRHGDERVLAVGESVSERWSICVCPALHDTLFYPTRRSEAVAIPLGTIIRDRRVEAGPNVRWPVERDRVAAGVFVIQAGLIGRGWFHDSWAESRIVVQ